MLLSTFEYLSSMLSCNCYLNNQGARLDLLENGHISSDVVDWPHIELYKSPRTQNGFRIRAASCTFKKLPTTLPRRVLKYNSMTDSISICVGYVLKSGIF